MRFRLIFLLSSCFISQFSLAQLVVGDGAVPVDDLTGTVRTGLATLGYEPGTTTAQTAEAVSNFEADHDLEVTGKITPLLADMVRVAVRQHGSSATASNASAKSAGAAAPDPQALEAAQQACLQRKIDAAQESRQKSRGLRRLASAVNSVASKLGGGKLTRGVTSGIYTATGVVDGVMSVDDAAEELGVTKSDIEECRNPL